MEIAAKIVITLMVLFVAAKALHWTWSSQIDPMATFLKFVGKKPKIATVVVTREPNKLYQDGKVVADVTGPVTNNNGAIILKQIANSSALDRGNPIEYGRMKLRIVRIGTITGMMSTISNGRSSVLQNVMEDVVCEELK